MDKFNYAEIFLSRKSAIKNTYRIIASDSVAGDNGEGFDLGAESKIPEAALRNFIKKAIASDFVAKDLDDWTLETLERFSNESEDVENLLAIIRQIGYDVFLIGLPSGGEGDMISQASYVLSRICSGRSYVYAGTKVDYDADDIPCSAEHVLRMTLSAEVLEDNGLDLCMESYQYLKNIDDIRRFNDQPALDFLENHGYKYVVQKVM